MSFIAIKEAFYTRKQQEGPQGSWQSLRTCWSSNRLKLTSSRRSWGQIAVWQSPGPFRKEESASADGVQPPNPLSSSSQKTSSLCYAEPNFRWGHDWLQWGWCPSPNLVGPCLKVTICMGGGGGHSLPIRHWDTEFLCQTFCDREPRDIKSMSLDTIMGS